MYFKRVNKLEISNVNKLNNTKQHLNKESVSSLYVLELPLLCILHPSPPLL